MPNALPGLTARFAVLGRLVAEHPDPVVVGRRRERCLLGVLLLEAGTAVPVDRLVSLLWDDDPPPSARAALHSHVARLRSAFDGPAVPALRLVRTSNGYQAEVDPELVDAFRFRALVERGRAERDAAGRAGLLRTALGLWRGPILAGDASDRLRDRIGGRLHELRLTATELMVDAELDRGRHAQITGELITLTAEHPTRERLAAQLMLALYRSGRHADALQFFQTFSDRLAAALGADPDTELRRLNTAILRQAPELRAGPATSGEPPLPMARPALLPPVVADFTARDAEVQRLRSALSPAEPAGALPVALITGPGGVGKSTLGLHVAHLLDDRFPDGVLYAGLGGVQPAPAEPVEVVGRFLNALGVPGGTVPAGLDERVDLYRSLLAGRRVLVVLDDARDLAQLRPLMPGSATCAVLVTSRRRLGGLAGATRVTLTVLGPEDAVRMLGRICGAARVGAEPGVAAEIAHRCGFLPLAIRVAGARLAVRADWPLRRLAQRLSAEHLRLDELAVDDLAVRASFAASYRDVSAEGRRALRRLALLDAPDFAAWVVAPLLDVPYERAEDLVDELVDTHLLETVGAFRYRFHDLIRLFALAHAEEEDEPRDRHDSVERALREWLVLAGAASARLPYRLLSPMAETDGKGGGALPPAEVEELTADPFAWLSVERAALVAAVRQAAAAGLSDVAWRLASVSRDLFDQRDHNDEFLAAHRAALAVCERDGDRLGTAVIRYGLACRALADEELTVDRTLRLAESARDAFAALGHPRAEVDAMVLAATLHRRRGDHVVAREVLEESAGRAARVGNPAAEAAAWRSLGVMHREQNRIEQARDCFAAALDLAQRHGLPDVEAFAYRGLGVVHRESGDFAASERAFEEALERYRRLGQDSGQAWALLDLGQLHTRRGDPRAGHALRRALAIFERGGVSEQHAIALRALGELCLAEDRPADAAVHLLAALRMWRILHEPWGVGLCLSALGAAHQRTGDHPRARTAWVEAEQRFREVGNDSEADRIAAQLAELPEPD